MNEQIIQEAKKGSETAFYQIYESTRQRIYNLAYRYVRIREEAEDIMQDTFIKAFQKIDTLEKENEVSLVSWLQSICVNTTLNHLRRRKRRSLFSTSNSNEEYPDPPSPQPSPEEMTQSQDHLAHIRKGFNQLPPKQRIIFDMRFYQHMDIKEIARQLNCSESNVKTQIMRSLTKLRKQLSPVWRDA